MSNDQNNKIKLGHQIVTPIDRMWAFLIDIIIIIGIISTVYIIVYPIVSVKSVWQSEVIKNVGIFRSLLIIAIIDLLFEIRMRGETFGKIALNIKITDLDGLRPEIKKIFLRWLLRPIDVFYFGIMSMLRNKGDMDQRLGDMVAGTIVIYQPQPTIPKDPVLAVQKDIIRSYLIDSYIIISLHFFYQAFLVTFLKNSVIFTMNLLILTVIVSDLIYGIKKKGQTPGKKYFNLKVVKLDGSSLPFSNYFLSRIPLFIFFIMGIGFRGMRFSAILYNPSSLIVLIASGIIISGMLLIRLNGRRLGDRFAGTVIIKDEQKITESLSEHKKEVPDTLIANIAEVSKNARSIYLIYIGLVAYCAITVFNTSDRRIVLNESVLLPVFNVGIDSQIFFIMAPFLTIFIFIYFHLYIHKLKRLMDDLRVNYQPINEAQRIYPWLLNFTDEPNYKIVGVIQKIIVTFSLWWSLPVILIFLAVWYLKTHDPFWVNMLGIMPLIGTVIVLSFWIPYHQLSGLYTRFKISQFVLLTLVLLFEIYLFLGLIPRAFRGERVIGTWPAVDLSYQNLTRKQDEEFKTLYWANLRGAQLQGANLTGVILEKADLRQANLNGATLKEAYLKDADLSNAFLKNADLREVNLSWANLSGTDLFDAKLQNADIQKATLRGANLRGTRLDSALLFGAEFDSTTDLRGAVLYQCSVDRENIKVASFLKKDIFRYKPIDELSLREVREMLLKHNFYNKMYDWNNDFSNPSGTGFYNKFELQQEGKVVVDLASGLIWQQSGSFEWMVYNEVESYITYLNREDFAGFSNWRLPTLEEAMTLMTIENSDGMYIDPVFEKKQEWIWTTDKYDKDRVWSVSFLRGACYRVTFDDYFYVRTVCSGY